MKPSRVLYLHGFASSPSSKKAVVLRDHFAKHDVPFGAVDLRVPTLEALRLSAMIEATCAALAPGDVLVGSSLGGLTAAHVAARDDRVAALVLLAPAFAMAARWKTRVGDEAVARWRETGFVELRDPNDPDMPPRLDFGFLTDLEEVEAAGRPQVRQPVLVVHGTGDESVPVAGSRAWVGELKARGVAARLVEVDDGHTLYASMDRVIGETDAFLASLPG